MQPWNRPTPRDDFAAESARALSDFRSAIADKTSAQGQAFKEIWNKSWHDGKHKVRLAEPFGSQTKCMWCERHRDLFRELSVEHYRPKARVTEWTGSPHFVSDKPPMERPVSEHGYWWLAYDWHNYSLACKTCNETWKRSLFPVRDRLPCEEGVEAREEPLLIDPASSFRSAEHFEWDGYQGEEVIVRPCSDRAHATIIVCGLNRVGLRVRRGKSARRIMAAIKALHTAARRRDRPAEHEALQTLQSFGADTSEFTSMARWIIEQETDIPWDAIADLDL